MFYESDLDMEDVQRELMEFAPRIVTFMKQYVRQHANACFNKKINVSSLRVFLFTNSKNPEN